MTGLVLWGFEQESISYPSYPFSTLVKFTILIWERSNKIGGNHESNELGKRDFT